MSSTANSDNASIAQKTNASDFDREFRYGMVNINSMTLYFMLFLILTGWTGILFNHIFSNYAPKMEMTDVFMTEGGVNPKIDRPFWHITFSTLIVFAIFFMILTSLIYVDKKVLFPRESGLKSVWGELLFSMTFVLSRLNIFFSEVFLMLIFIAFIYLNFKFYDVVKRRMDISGYNISTTVLLISTGLQILVFMYSYIMQRDTSRDSSFLGNMPMIRNILFPMRLMQLQTNPRAKRQLNDNMKYMNAVLIVIGASCIMFMYIILKFYITEG